MPLYNLLSCSKKCIFYKINLHEGNLRCVSAQGVDANGAGNRNMFGQAKRLLHGNGGGRRNVVGQAGTGVGGNNLCLVIFFGQGNVSGISVLKETCVHRFVGFF